MEKTRSTVARLVRFTLGGTIAGTPAYAGHSLQHGDLVGFYLPGGKTADHEETRRLTQYYAAWERKGVGFRGTGSW